MKWFDQWFYRKARWCWHRAEAKYPELKAEQDYLDEKINIWNDSSKVPMVRDSMVCRTDEIDLERPIRFKIAAAEGGMIVEVQTYDHKNEHNITKHHIIPDDVDDKSDAIAKIVTLEFLRRPH